MRWRSGVAAAVVATMGLTACGSLSGTSSGGNRDRASGNDQASASASAAFLPDAKGPAPEIAGARKGGTLTIRARKHGGEIRGTGSSYVVIDVIDTGVGMSEDVQARAFGVHEERDYAGQQHQRQDEARRRCQAGPCHG